MGKISDAIEQIEDELKDALEDVAILQKVNEELNERITELATIVEEYNLMEDYMEEHHPGIVTAFEVSRRMAK